MCCLKFNSVEKFCEDGQSWDVLCIVRGKAVLMFGCFGSQCFVVPARGQQIVQVFSLQLIFTCAKRVNCAAGCCKLVFLFINIVINNILVCRAILLPLLHFKWVTSDVIKQINKSLGYAQKTVSFQENRI